MELTPDQAASAVERHDCPNCAAPAGSPCRTRGGKTAAKYHTPRFVLVPALREELDVAVPSDRLPGRAWEGDRQDTPETGIIAGQKRCTRVGGGHGQAHRDG